MVQTKQMATIGGWICYVARYAAAFVLSMIGLGFAYVAAAATWITEGLLDLAEKLGPN